MASVHEFWADRMAAEIIARVEQEPQLKQLVAKHGYFVYDEKTPSGEIHIGSGRGWVIHDVLAKALRDKGVEAKFVLSSDDYDPFDKPIKGRPEFDQYLGVPFINIPSPVEGYASWAEYYFQQSASKFAEWGIDAELASTGKDYQDGVFNAAIKTALDNHKKIAAIFERIYEKPYEKLPFSPICEKCGKIGTTVATAWDSEKELVAYECRENLVKWAKGCKHQGEMSPYNGNGKLPWKVEWAAKWPSKGVIVETAGKDHFTKKGSRTVANAIAIEVFDYPPPYPSAGYDEGRGYEFFNIGGKKMSTSKGVGYSFAKITDHLPANILRFLMASYKPTTAIDFDPSRQNDLLLLYDRYDTAERVYYNVEESDRKEELSRTYHFSHIGALTATMPPQISLRHAGMIVQVAKSDKEGIALLQKYGHAPAKLSPEEQEYLVTRFNAARQWLAEFAPESEKFTVQTSVSDEVKAQLSEGQKGSLQLLKERLSAKEYTEQELFEEFYKICESVDIKNTEFFKGAYLVLLKKSRGPKLANLLLTIGQKGVGPLLEQVN